MYVLYDVSIHVSSILIWVLLDFRKDNTILYHLLGKTLTSYMICCFHKVIVLQSITMFYKMIWAFVLSFYVV